MRPVPSSARSSAADKYPVSRRVSRRSLATARLARGGPRAARGGLARRLVTEFSTGLTLTNAPADIAAGPDGNLWFTEQGLLPGVGSIDPGRPATSPSTPPACSNVPGDIVGGPDGGVWFTIAGANESVARIDPGTGDIVTHAVAVRLQRDRPRRRRRRQPLVHGAADKGKLGRMAPDGQVTEFDADLSGDETLNDVAVGPDGWIWFTVEHDGGAAARTSSLHSISRVNPADGDICHFSEGLTGAPNKIVAASDGKLYFTESGDPGRDRPHQDRRHDQGVHAPA